MAIGTRMAIDTAGMTGIGLGRRLREPAGLHLGMKAACTTTAIGTEIGAGLITMVNGFELFNTRPYHNYETWSDGYRITDGITTVEREDLDDAVRAFVDEVAKAKIK